MSKVPAPTTSVAVTKGLAFKQAMATLLIALGVALSSIASQVVTEYRTMRGEVTERVKANLALVRGLAGEAAFQVSSELAGEVVAGLSLDPTVIRARLADDYGGELGRMERQGATAILDGMALRLFGDLAVHQLPLHFRGMDGQVKDVGRLEVELDPRLLFNRYVGRLSSSVVSGAAGAVLICLLVVAVFHGMITKSLLRITASVGKVDPARPGAHPVEVPRRHRADEFGLLAETLNLLLRESQRGLEARDTAEAALAALAQDLERRVQERTAELAREKETVERANAELEKVNRYISDGIRYASRIQAALLPEKEALGDSVKEIAIGWQPFDVVGGDCYWIGELDGKGIVAVMDCTGHGVPGAFMTAVVYSVLLRVLHHHGHEDPGEMLSLMNTLVKAALRQDRPDAPTDDGLDAAICIIDRDKGLLRFAGANLPLLVWADGAFRRIRGDRESLGYRTSPDDIRFTVHELPLTPGATFYLYTDGLIDHVGGQTGRLFGRHRLQDALVGVVDLPLEEQKAALFAHLDDYRAGEPRRDDMTFVAFRPAV